MKTQDSNNSATSPAASYTLVIAEKPSVGRDIARVLQCKAKGEGCLIGEHYIISWAIGHLVTLCEPDDYNPAYKKWSFDPLPIIPEQIKLKAIAKTRPQLKILHTLMNSTEVDSIICATDSGREGELIFRYIYEITGCKKPFSRLWISSMTDSAIKAGFEKIKDGTCYDALYLSAKCRSEADWLVGINATRAYTLKYNTLLSIGRVQTPTLSIIVDRQKEIDAFVPQDYYEVVNDYGNFSGTWFFGKETQSRITEKEKADAIAFKMKKATGFIEKITKEEKKQPPPLLYDLTELQRDCNKKFGFSATKTLSIVQELYEKRKMVTYPRTDSRYLSEDMAPKLPIILKKMDMLSEFAPFVAPLLSKDRLPLSKRIIDGTKVTDHHAIIPTEAFPKIDSLTKEEKEVYRLIVMRFLSVFHPFYHYAITKVITRVQEETFLSKGTTIVQLGWMEIYHTLDASGKKEKKKKEDTPLPILQEGDAITVKKSSVLSKKTTPPAFYTEASLLSAMENAGRFVEEEDLKEQLKASGLGTPATRAAIIERLLSVGYLERSKKNLIPTEKAKKLMEVIPKELKSPQTTGKWEKGLRSIAQNNMDEKRFMDSIKRYVAFLASDAKNGNSKVVFAQEEFKNAHGKNKSASLGTCPLCNNGKILENSKSFFCTQWRNGCKFTVWKNCLDSYGNPLTPQKMKKLLKEKRLEEQEITLPQTGEKGTASIHLKLEDNHVQVEIINYHAGKAPVKPQ